jgi:large subunit ribosomal protein L9
MPMRSRGASRKLLRKSTNGSSGVVAPTSPAARGGRAAWAHPGRGRESVRQSGKVELLLIQPIETLGKQGDVVEVRRGYALNYLLPQGLATIATEHHKRMVEKHRAKLEEIARQRLAGLRSLLAELVRTSVTIEANANDEGHLYGSVGAAEIARSLKQQDLLVAPDQIILQGPLKEVGLYTVKVRLAPEVEGDLKVWVVPSSGDSK